MNHSAPPLGSQTAAALQAHQNGEKARAHQLYSAALRSNPGDFHANHLLGVLMHQHGQQAQAEQLVRRAIEQHPQVLDPWVNLGAILLAAGRAREAEEAYRHALSLDVQSDAAWRGLGNTLAELQKPKGAEDAYANALKWAPENHETLFNLATLTAASGEHTRAIALCERCLAIEPGLVPAYGLLGDSHLNLGDEEAALRWLEAGLKIDPRHPELLYAKGFALSSLGQLQSSIVCFDKALESAPEHGGALAAALFTRRQLCSWEGTDRLVQRFRQGLAQGIDGLTPFSFLAESDDRRELLRCGEIWSRQWRDKEPLWPLPDSNHHYPGTGPLPCDTQAEGLITLGYLSADFYNHPTAHLSAGLFEAHDRNKFRVIAYSNSRDDSSAIRKRLERGFDEFVDLRPFSVAQSAQRIQADGVDILIDLKGHTLEAATGVLARRPAPLQVQYLGYPGSMGAAFMDYVLGDAWVTPPEHRAEFSECIVQLPESYQINDRLRPTPAARQDRQSLGLPDNAVLMCCFNNSWKINPDVFDAWMTILRSSDNAFLWLLGRQEAAGVISNLGAAAEARGVSRERLRFSKSRPLEDYLALYHHADLFLDTWPYNAHTTASDALWMGCPVITRSGDSFASRVGASLLSAVYLPELIFSSTPDFIAGAIDLCGDPKRLRALRRHLLESRLSLPLFDTQQTTQNMEAAYQRMLELRRQGQRQAFKVEAP